MIKHPGRAAPTVCHYMPCCAAMALAELNVLLKIPHLRHSGLTGHQKLPALAHMKGGLALEIFYPG